MAMMSVVWFLGLCSVLFGYGVEVEASHHLYRNLQSLQSNSINQPYRTGFHFQPSKNWMNGPMIYKGIYHLFYQYNPLGAVWGNIVWAHATSTDLINWIHHDHAIYPSEPFDINGCWSGSTTFLPGEKPAILYTGIDPQNRQVQNIAVPKNLSDPYLREWIKPVDQNPLMTPINGINASSFRDPTTAWKGPDGRWRVIIGSKINRRGLAILYRSKDFIHWIKSKHPLHSAKRTGMWECPDFFPVSVHGKNGVDTSEISPSVKHVLKVSLDDTKHEYYTVGTYYHDKDKYIPDHGSIDDDSGLRYDYGKFYASKTFFDSEKNRRILWGWINESSSVSDDVKKGWSGVQAIPRTLWLDKTGRQLIQWPVEEIKALRTNRVDLPTQDLKGGSVLRIPVVTASQADVEISFELPKLEDAEIFDPSSVDPQLLCSQKQASVGGKSGPFGLLVLASAKLEEQTAIFFRVFKDHKIHNKYVVVMCSDQSRSSLGQGLDKTTYGAFLNVDPLHDKLSLRSLVDHSIVESFGGEGKTCITARVYPKLAIGEGAHLYAFNNGAEKVRISSLTAWSMKKAQIN
ncbi:Glycoside hydrolase [Macleaya cordata]|uniref:Glycoside hydrolase n=1 Tax=Macleaya cordata TaxID=56857 RepID=A0A200QDH0_MACCD|nr:Glycoside hydrolase [Macleaya cordata]